MENSSIDKILTEYMLLLRHKMLYQAVMVLVLQ